MNAPAKNPRILHVLDHSIPLHSGYTFRTLSILRAQHQRGWHTDHLTSPKQINCTVPDEIVDGLTFYRTHQEPHWQDNIPVLRERRQMKATEQRLQGLVQRLKPDLIHAHSPVLNAIPAIRVARRLGIPVAYEVRAFWEDAAVDHGSTTEGSLRYRLTRALETWALNKVDAIFTICEGLRADIVARGIAANKVTVIPNAVDIEKFSMAGQPDNILRAQLGLQNALVLGFIGSFYAYEGLDLAIRALPAILELHPQARLLLVGGGPQEAALKQLAANLKVIHAVVFVGRVPHQEVNRYYDLVDALIYPRHSMRLTELVTPLKPLEAMAQGRLLIASDVGGHKELIRDGQTGVLFKSGETEALVSALQRLLTLRNEWDAMRQRARQFVEHERNWPNSIRNYQPVYSQLLNTSVA